MTHCSKDSRHISSMVVEIYMLLPSVFNFLPVKLFFPVKLPIMKNILGHFPPFTGMFFEIYGEMQKCKGKNFQNL